MRYLKYIIKNILFLFLYFIFNINMVLANNYDKSDFISIGCVQFDSIIWRGDRGDDFLSGAMLKATDLFFKGSLKNDYVDYFLHIDFINKYKSSNLSQAYVMYSRDDYSIKIGQMIIPFGLEQSISVNHRVFMESSMIRNLTENRFFGINFEYHDGLYTLSAALVSYDINYSLLERYYDSKYSFLFRATVNPIEIEDAGVLHFGFSYRDMRKRSGEENPTSTIAFLDIPSLNSVNPALTSYPSPMARYFSVGMEFCFIWDSLFLSSELVYIYASWEDFDRENYGSWYTQLSYMLTGESRLYNKRTGSIREPKSNYDFGIFELTARYSYTYINNTGALLRGMSSEDGKKSAYTFGINWIINENLKIQINCVYEEFRYRIVDDRDIYGLGARVQFLF